MANLPPGGNIAPGIVTPGGQDTYPQYGAGGGTPGVAAGWKVVTAHNAAEKLSYENQGFLLWFSTKAAAQAEVSSQSSAFGSGEPQNALGLARIGDFFASLGQASTWVRVGEVVLGLVLLAVGVARITHAVPIATKVAKTAGAVALA